MPRILPTSSCNSTETIPPAHRSQTHSAGDGPCTTVGKASGGISDACAQPEPNHPARQDAAWHPGTGGGSAAVIGDLGHSRCTGPTPIG